MLLGCALAASFSGVPPASAQQSEDLQQQLQQLRRQYEETTQQLEDRIAALEQKIEAEKETHNKTKGITISPQDLAQEAAKEAVLGQADQVGAEYQGQIPSEPRCDLLRGADAKIAKLQEQVSSFEFHGYFRSGYGLNSVGRAASCLRSPRHRREIPLGK